MTLMPSNHFKASDWDYEYQFKLGFEGGKKYLTEHVFKIKKGHAPEMKELREFIKDSYESIGCFLMPHPGETVARNKVYDGRWSAIDSIFVEHLKKLVPRILAPENLVIKKIAGKEVTGESLYWNMKFYLELFKSDLLPSPQSIYEATVTKSLQDMVSRYLSEYRESISKGSEAVTTHTDFNIFHLDSKKKSNRFL
jgi:atlastin